MTYIKNNLRFVQSWDIYTPVLLIKIKEQYYLLKNRWIATMYTETNMGYIANVLPVVKLTER